MYKILIHKKYMGFFTKVCYTNQIIARIVWRGNQALASKEVTSVNEKGLMYQWQMYILRSPRRSCIFQTYV